MDEMKIVAAIADDNCIVIEEGTSTSSTKQPGTENMLWKKFDQRVVLSMGENNYCRNFS